mgnify:CR=1 FL=1
MSRHGFRAEILATPFDPRDAPNSVVHHADGLLVVEDGHVVAIGDYADVAPRFADLKSHRIVALAGGTSKTRAIRAILAHGLLFGLITDEATAQHLVALKPGREPGKKNGKTAAG